MNLDILLKQLADGSFHSGDALGGILGVSRTAVWKQIKKIEELGLPIESIKGRGYRLVGGLDLLAFDVVSKGLSSEATALVSELDIRGVVESTNTLAMSKAISASSGYVCTAEQQLKGRGRRGRHWASPYASSLSLSIVWEFRGGVSSLEGLSLAVGVVVVEALNQAGVDGVQLKWPNDVLHNDRKLSGVLVEISGDAQGPCRVVLGIGLNVSTPKGNMEQVDQPWIDIKSISCEPITRNQLLILLLNKLMPTLAGFESEGFALYRDRWQRLDAYTGRDVELIMGENIVTGKATGVDTTGAIIIETAAGTRTFNGGEISLRLNSNSDV